jgi:cell division protease FtsH
MNAFDRIIGYDTIKTELFQICDMIRNRKIYEDLGAKLPQGVLLYGAPGLGKTLMAKCFIEESGLKTFTIRRNTGGDEFVSVITDTFNEAKKNAPCIVFLDDLDKFASEKDDFTDAEEYVAVQSGIDDVKNCGVFVLATVNKIRKLPRSLVRSGRFDRKIEVLHPTDDDADAIIRHYLSKKKVADSVDLEDLSKMISYSSCAELATILNEAAIRAAYERRRSIGMDDLVKAVLKLKYDSAENDSETDGEGRMRTALHEAGHLVVSEVLCPGSVGLASLRSTIRNETGGFIHRCRDVPGRSQYVLISLAGKAAVELYYADPCTDGCRDDIRRAYDAIRDGISEEATHGFGLVDVSTHTFPETTENYKARNEAVTHAELERCMLKTRNILLKNMDFLEKAAEALMEKGTLLYSDIQALKDSSTITEAAG